MTEKCTSKTINVSVTMEFGSAKFCAQREMTVVGIDFQDPSNAHLVASMFLGGLKQLEYESRFSTRHCDPEMVLLYGLKLCALDSKDERIRAIAKAADDYIREEYAAYAARRRERGMKPS